MQHSVPDHYHGTEQHSRGASRASISVPMNVDNSDPVEVQNEHDGYWDDLEPETITERIALFLATFKAKSAQTYSTVRFVVQQTSSLVSDIVSSLQRKTMYLFEKFGHRDDPGVKQLAHDFEAAASPFEGFESEFKQMQYFVKSGNFIDPVEEAFTGESFVQRRASATGTVRQVLLQDTFYRVPLKPLLLKVLEIPGILDAIFAWQQREDGVLSDFYDGEYCKQHPLFSREVSVPLLLYNDDCETVNPLGSKVAVHKLGFIYLVIKSLPPVFLSKLSSHFLVAVYKVDDAKTYGIDSVLRPVIEELKDLEVNGISLNTSHFKGEMRCSVAQLCGDNLGLNAILGFTECFSSNYFCRICKAHKTITKTQTKEDATLIRNEANYAADVSRNSMSDTGVKRDSILNNLSNFNVTHNKVLDIMHDLLEGVGPFELKLVLASLIEDKHLTLDTLNFRITSFDYGFSDVKNKPTVIGKQELKIPERAMRQSASQTWCLLRHVPCMIGDLIPEENKHWELLLLLLECMEIVFSPSLTPEVTVYLAAIIEEHHSLFLELYPHKHLIPKHHLMVHYPGAILKLGPLIQFWAMRFEAKHAFFKRICHITCNFRNICKTMAFRHQMTLCYSLLAGDVFKPETEIGPGHSTLLAVMDGFGEVQSGLEDIPPFTETFVPTWVKVNGTQYRPGVTVFLSYAADGDPQFGLVKNILVLDHSVKLVVQKWDTVGFDRHLFAYGVEATTNVFAVDQSSLQDYHGLHAAKSYRDDDNCSYVSLRYRVF